MSEHQPERNSAAAPTTAPIPRPPQPNNLPAKYKRELLDIQDSLPHALGHEKAVLSVFMQHPSKLAEPHGITAGTYYLPAHQILFKLFQDISENGKPEDVELVAIVQRLIDMGQLEAVGGPAAITELASYSPNPSHFANHCQILHEKHAERLLVLAGIAAMNGDAVEHSRLIQERDGIIQIATKRNVLMEKLESLRYDPNAPPPPDEACLQFLNRVVAARGNVTGVQAKQKAGKSAFVSAILGTALRGDFAAVGDTLGLEWLGEATGAILHIDTEQSRADWHAGVKRAEKRAGLPATERLHSYSIVTFKLAERMEILGQKMQALAESGGIDCVILDGGADFLASVNNEELAIELVSELMRLAHKYNCLIVVVIHENPSTLEGKTRGHLGSELQRKAFANIRIDKDSDTGISTIYATDNRRGDIPKMQGLCFQWDNEAGMHVTLGIHSELVGQKKESEKIKKEREKWAAIYEYDSEKRDKNACPDLSPKQAAEIIRDMNGTENSQSENTIKKQMQRAETLGVLRKNNRGTWTLI